METAVLSTEHPAVEQWMALAQDLLGISATLATEAGVTGQAPHPQAHSHGGQQVAFTTQAYLRAACMCMNCLSQIVL